MFRRAVRGKASPDDSADATQLIKSGAPIAFPTCGSQPDRPWPPRADAPRRGVRVVL